MDNFTKYEAIEGIFLAIWETAILLFPSKARAETRPGLSFINKGVGTAGKYYPKTKTVEINIAYFTGYNRAEITTTIVHEICHHLTTLLFKNFTQWHGPEFKMIMSLMGEEGKTYHSMDRKEAESCAKRTKNDMLHSLPL